MSGSARGSTIGARPAGDLVSIAERGRWFTYQRLGVAALVIGVWTAAPTVDRLGEERVAVLAAGYAAAAILLDVATARRRRAASLVGAALLVDAAFLAVVRYATGGLTSPLAFLTYAHVASIAVAVSYRSGIRFAIWHALFLLATSYAEAAAIVPVTESPSLLPGGSSFVPVAALSIGAFAVVAVVAGSSSALSERELRAQKVDLSALSVMVQRLSIAAEAREVCTVLVAALKDAFGCRRVVVALTSEDGRIVSCHGDRTTMIVPPGIDPVMLTAAERRRVELLSRTGDDVPRIAAMLPGARNVVVAAMRGTGDTRASGFVVMEFPSRTVKRWVVALIEQFVSSAATALTTLRLMEALEERLIENRALQARLADHNVRLEDEVHRRTEDLRVTLTELATVSDERRRLLERLVAAQEAERQRVADDLHDDPLQKLAGVAMHLGLAARSGTEETRQPIERARELVGASIESMRTMIFELRPTVLDQRGIAAALRESLERSSPDLAWRVVDELDREPPDEIRLIMYRIAQEALANVRKHARASSVDVVLASAPDGYVVRIDDDGAGFAQPDRLESAPGHLGLTSMRERAQMAGGHCQLESRPGRGTTVELWLPATLTPEARGRIVVLEDAAAAEAPMAGAIGRATVGRSAVDPHALPES